MELTDLDADTLAHILRRISQRNRMMFSSLSRHLRHVGVTQEVWQCCCDNAITYSRLSRPTGELFAVWYMELCDVILAFLHPAGMTCHFSE